MTSSSPTYRAGEHPFLRHVTDPDAKRRNTTGRPLSTFDESAEKMSQPEGTEAISEAMEHSNAFCALVLKIDGPAPQKKDASADQQIMACIDQAAQTHAAVSCRWKDSLCLCVLPSAGTGIAQKFAQGLVSNLARRRPETISIGIAPFPLLGYDKHQSLENACKALDHAAFLGPGSIVTLDAVSLNISGDRYYQAGEIDKAISEYSAALELDPNNTNVRNSLGVCFGETGDAAAARESFEIVLAIDSTESMAMYNLGMLYLMENQVRAALDQFLQAYKIGSDFYEIPYQIATLLRQAGRWDEALPYINAAIEMHRDFSPLHSLKGACLSAMGDTAGAIAAYTRCVKLSPNDAQALSALGYLYDIKNENPDICRTFLEQSVTLAPENGLYHHRLGRWHHKHRQFEQADASYRLAISLGHDSHRHLEDLQTELERLTQTANRSRRAG